MNSIKLGKVSLEQKDIIKGQKIVAAIYLVTNHLPEQEPIRHSLRALSISFVEAQRDKQKTLLAHLEILLGAAVLAGLISDKNTSIIVYEAKRFLDDGSLLNDGALLSSLFEGPSGDHMRATASIKDIKKTSDYSAIRTTKGQNTALSFSSGLTNKTTRQDKIIAFINERKSAVIKDITSLFPEVSEKTIQRELNVLIEEGRITKRGSKRWSMYMAVNSLL